MMCMPVLTAYMFVYYMGVWYPRLKIPGVTNSCEPPCVFWELDPGLEEQQVFLTAESLHFFI